MSTYPADLNDHPVMIAWAVHELLTGEIERLGRLRPLIDREHYRTVAQHVGECVHRRLVTKYRIECSEVTFSAKPNVDGGLPRIAANIAWENTERNLAIIDALERLYNPTIQA